MRGHGDRGVSWRGNPAIVASQVLVRSVTNGQIRRKQAAIIRKSCAGSLPIPKEYDISVGLASSHQSGRKVKQFTCIHRMLTPIHLAEHILLL